jgi:hypothetical protein
MRNTVIQLAMMLCVFVVFVIPVFVFGLICSKRKHKRRSPLTRDLLRPPGFSLSCRVADVDLQIETGLVMLVITCPAVFICHLSGSYFLGEPESASRIVGSILCAVTLLFLSGRNVWQQMAKKRQLVLALEGEQFVGEQLNQLMLKGCRVFHDFPFDYGNIDHVVVSNSGVFSVNTKMHGKLTDKSGGADVLVDYPNKCLRFSDREIPLPMEQLETEANWLSKFLTSAVAFPVEVEAMLALPGWFVKHQGRQKEPYVFSPANSERFFVHNRQRFTPQQIQQIAHQLDQKCRDVEPTAKDPPKRWEE